jgi:hypothetical protein
MNRNRHVIKEALGGAYHNHAPEGSRLIVNTLSGGKHVQVEVQTGGEWRAVTLERDAWDAIVDVISR